MSVFNKKKAIVCHDCHQSVFGSIKIHHERECSAKSHTGSNGSTSSKSLTCYDCGKEVSGNIKNHHQNECDKSKKQKSIVTSSQPSSGTIPNSVSNKFADTNDVYFVLDVSGSMEGAKMNVAKDTLKEMSAVMDNHDRIAVITFDEKAYFKLKPRSVEQIKRQNELGGLLDRVFSKGCTALYDAIYMGISQLRSKEITTIFNVLTDEEDNASTHTFSEVLNLLKTYPNVKLNIIHISRDGKTNVKEYSEICKDRGQYCNVSEKDMNTIPGMVVNMYKTIIINVTLAVNPSAVVQSIPTVMNAFA
jgi:Mg-chelatase subunit ChlD